MLKWFLRRDFVWLFGALLLPYVVYPFVEGHRGAGATLNVFITGAVVAGVLRTGLRRGRLTLLLVLGIPALVLIWISQILPSDSAVIARAASSAAFFACTAGLIVEAIVGAKRVTRNVVFGAACFYLLLAHTWTFIYVAIESAAPGSFQGGALSGLGGISAGGHALVAKFMYFSGVTLTTLGYGDITPVTTGAQMVTSLEAMAGQLCVAFLVARIVGLYIVHSQGPAAPSEADSR